MTESGRTAIVTGGSRGIGAAVTRLLAKRGLRVACTYRTGREQAEAVAAESGDAVMPVHYDLGDPVAAESLVSTVVAQWGGLDTVVLNAGVWRGGRLSDLDPAVWWEVVQTNLGGAAALTRAALPALHRSPAASVVLVASAVGITGFPGDTAYASAKAALTGFARSLAKEVGPAGIRVNVLAPGFVETDMTAAVSPRARTRITDGLILGRFGTAQEIATAAVFLAEDATYCTGTVLVTDGGWSI